MRTHSYIFAGLIVLLVLGAVGMLVFELQNTPPTIVTPTPTDSMPVETDITVLPSVPAETVPTAVVEPMITVSAPSSNATIVSPLTVTGSARGTWYFEASFPIELWDASGNMLVQTHGQAQGEWMTENFVPFTSTLTWATTTATSGTLILRRDNPSGLPEHDRSVSIPVLF